MQNTIWKKGLGIGIILLFLGASVLPSITGYVVNFDTDNNNRNNSANPETVTHIIIGTINLITKNPPHDYVFEGRRGFGIVYTSWSGLSVVSIGGTFFTYYDIEFKIGIVTKHFVCAMFHFHMW